MNAQKNAVRSTWPILSVALAALFCTTSQAWDYFDRTYIWSFGWINNNTCAMLCGGTSCRGVSYGVNEHGGNGYATMINAGGAPVGPIRVPTEARINTNGRVGDKAFPVTMLGRCVFYGCDEVTDIFIPDCITNIGYRCFYKCTGLTTMTVPDSVASLGESAFDSCTNLTSVTLPAKHVTLGEYLFENCTSLPTVDLPTDATILPEGLFFGCTALSNVTIPGSVNTIGKKAFAGCTGLPAISIPESVSTIGEAAFMDCTLFTSIVFPKGVATLGPSAFSGCSGLTSVTFSDTMTSIGDSAFSDCSGLTTMMIPLSVTSIGRYAFNNCFGLKTLYLPIHFEGNTRDFAIPEDCTVIFYSGNIPHIPQPPAANTYTIRFSSNGGTGEMPDVAAESGADVVLPANSFTPASKKYVFAGWAMSSAEAGSHQVAYPNKASVRNLTTNGGMVTLYAVWAKKTYKVAFYSTYKKGVTGKMSVQSFTYGKSKRLSANKFKRKGYKFIGWARSKADAKRGRVAYKGRKKVKNLVMTGKTVKLYAVWRKK